MNQKIKSILYLDKHKLYSISSQVFEGLTENVTRITASNDENAESQKGPAFSGRLLASIVTSASSVSETRFLHDHSYVTLERELQDKGKVLEIDSPAKEVDIDVIMSASFVKVRGRAEILDQKQLRAVMSQFNKIGVSLATVTNAGKLEEAKSEAREQAAELKDRNARAVRNAVINKKISPESLAKDAGLYQNPDLLKSLEHLMEFGFGDRCQIDMVVPSCTGERIRVSSILDREHLRESEDRIIAKYSMFPQRDFVLFGIPVQGPSSESGGTSESTGMPASVKQGVLETVRKLSILNDQFVGCGPNEIVVDPLAVYLEL